MNIHEFLKLIPILFAGIGLGILFFGGLWLTVRIGLNSKRPSIIFLGSLIIRMGIVVMGFYYIGAESWQNLISCLLGFLVARLIIIYVTNKDKQLKTKFIKGTSDEN